MLRIAFIYGAIAGTVVIGVMTFAMILDGEEKGAASGQVFGYLTMLVALTLIFVGVKRHRDLNYGGVITFFPALLTGLAIAAVAGVFYVIGWEIYLAASDYAFISQYTNAIIEQKKADGVTGVELEKLIGDMAVMEQNYKNPLLRLPITFSEIFPVGLLISVVSAALLQNPKILPAQS